MVQSRILFFDAQRCTGCRVCELICSLTKSGECNPRKAFIRVLANEEMNINIVTLGMGCDLCGGKEKCVKFCQPKALKFVEPNLAALIRKRAVTDMFPAPLV